ncbi:aldehyde dehydrogenase family protein [Pseudomonas sp. TH31]|uniref:aldehyde dehydrogenase family protein n=1 Tax=Pseudomonas sp. TH31 TaxID=2796396 RepID=UPI001F5C0708|nr:aldehyde dehydrogenase family protein [Pseudomonas sp. TH31]
MLAVDNDLNDALPSIARGEFFHSGQGCVSVQRIFCHRSITERVAERLGQLGDATVADDPTDPRTDVGPRIAECKVTAEPMGQWVNGSMAPSPVAHA